MVYIINGCLGTKTSSTLPSSPSPYTTVHPPKPSLRFSSSPQPPAAG